MKKIAGFLDKHLGYVLVIPAIIFILTFSILPIAQSMRYAFFDFQLNDQQKSGLYFSERYNKSLMEETHEYIGYFLESEMEIVEKPETKKAIEAGMASINEHFSAIGALVDQPEDIQEISGQQRQEIEQHSTAVVAELDKIYANNDTFALKEDMYAVASELDGSIIEPNFIGLQNFQKILTDERVHSSIYVTLFFTVFSVLLELCLGLALAMIMNKAMKGQGIIRTMSLIPWAIPTSVAALIWAYMYNGDNGIVATLLAQAGIIGGTADLLLSSTGALWSVIFADVWKTTPYMALLLLAGLQTIPTSLYEAASIDGANKWKQFIHVTLPLLKPSIMVALLFRTLDAFRVFDLIWVLTGGGPGGSTESISIYAYKTMFAQTRFGYGSAVIILMALVVGIISYAYIKLLDVKLTNN